MTSPVDQDRSTLAVTTRRDVIAGSASPPRWTLPAVFAHFRRLQERRTQLARTLSGGEQQMLAIGRALMTNPTLLILDEATEGLAPFIRGEIWSMILAVLKQLADRHYALQKGRTVWSGDSAALHADAAVVQGFTGL